MRSEKDCDLATNYFRISHLQCLRRERDYRTFIAEQEKKRYYYNKADVIESHIIIFNIASHRQSLKIGYQGLFANTILLLQIQKTQKNLVF